MILKEEERLDKYAKAGKEAKPKKSSNGLSLEEVHKQMQSKLDSVAELLGECNRLKGKKKLQLAKSQIEQYQSEMLKLMNSLEIPRRLVQDACQEIRSAWSKIAEWEGNIALVAKEIERDTRRQISGETDERKQATFRHRQRKERHRRNRCGEPIIK